MKIYGLIVNLIRVDLCASLNTMPYVIESVNKKRRCKRYEHANIYSIARELCNKMNQKISIFYS